MMHRCVVDEPPFILLEGDLEAASLGSCVPQETFGVILDILRGYNHGCFLGLVAVHG